jgi:hypothetical protein
MDSSAQLAIVDAAIADLLAGRHSAYSIEGRSVSRLSLAELRAWRRELIDDIEAESGSQIRIAKMGGAGL